MILGPDDPRALRRTGKTWRGRSGKEYPVMADALGNEFKTVTGSIADISRASGELNRMLDELAESDGTV